jgi:hypothetical protein
MIQDFKNLKIKSIYSRFSSIFSSSHYSEINITRERTEENGQCGRETKNIYIYIYIYLKGKRKRI